jgi:hypothetical protein
MRNKGVDVTPRTRGKMPYSGVVQKEGHETALVMELRYRHIVLYRIGRKRKLETIVFTPAFDIALSNEKGGASFEKLTFTEKKLLLMADEERLWSMDRLLNKKAAFDTNTMNADFDNKTFRVLDTAEVNFGYKLIGVIRPHNIIFWKGREGRDPNESLPEASW